MSRRGLMVGMVGGSRGGMAWLLFVLADLRLSSRLERGKARTEKECTGAGGRDGMIAHPARPVDVAVSVALRAYRARDPLWPRGTAAVGELPGTFFIALPPMS